MKKKIRLTKYAFNEDSEYTTLDSSFELNQDHPNGINIGYVKTGIILADPVVGESMWMSGENNRMFSSSTVTAILQDGFKTVNSYYRIEVLETLD